MNQPHQLLMSLANNADDTAMRNAQNFTAIEDGVPRRVRVTNISAGVEQQDGRSQPVECIDEIGSSDRRSVEKTGDRDCAPDMRSEQSQSVAHRAVYDAVVFVPE